MIAIIIIGILFLGLCCCFSSIVGGGGSWYLLSGPPEGELGGECSASGACKASLRCDRLNNKCVEVCKARPNTTCDVAESIPINPASHKCDYTGCTAQTSAGTPSSLSPSTSGNIGAIGGLCKTDGTCNDGAVCDTGICWEKCEAQPNTTCSDPESIPYDLDTFRCNYDNCTISEANVPKDQCYNIGADKWVYVDPQGKVCKIYQHHDDDWTETNKTWSRSDLSYFCKNDKQSRYEFGADFTKNDLTSGSLDRLPECQIPHDKFKSHLVGDKCYRHDGKLYRIDYKGLPCAIDEASQLDINWFGCKTPKVINNIRSITDREDPHLDLNLCDSADTPPILYNVDRFWPKGNSVY